jgi:hypothetical protein
MVGSIVNDGAHAMSAEQNFRAIAPRYMGLLRADFSLTAEEAAAVFGNFGHESMGFTALQELKPTVKGSRGGYGWPQWTGGRRKAYEAYCKKHGKDPASPAANYSYVFVELKTTEKHALKALRAAKTLEDKVIAFEKAFERAGVKHYESRQQWARTALSAYVAAGSPMRDFGQAIPVPKPPIVRPGEAAGGVAAGGAGLAAAGLLSLPLWAWLAIGGLAIAGVLAWRNRHAIATQARLLLGKL